MSKGGRIERWRGEEREWDVGSDARRAKEKQRSGIERGRRGEKREALS